MKSNRAPTLTLDSQALGGVIGAVIGNFNAAKYELNLITDETQFHCNVGNVP